ncbi:MAG: quinone-interacting membrane-bound oxidoreductase complex subunit QmoC [Nitrospirota bacterium]
MSDATVIKPDLAFVNEIIKGGGESLKKCYQCATCSVVCNVTPDESPFPRKEMALAQWGQKDQLITSADVWLCHQCSDCTAYCPRGAKPGEVLNAIRKQSIKHVAMVPFFAKLATDWKLLPVLFLIPMAIFSILLMALGNTSLASIPRGEDGAMVYHKFVPILAIDIIFTLTAAFAAFSAFVGIKRLWNGMKGQAGEMKSSGDLKGNIIASLTQILTHAKFADCSVNRLRQFGHLFLFYSFIGLATTTAWAVVYIYGHKIFGIEPIGPLHFGLSPFPNNDPLKILALASSIAFAAGIAIILFNRIVKAGKAGMGSYFDWIFLAIVIGVGATGMLSWYLRLANASAGYAVYYFHLVFVWSLFAYAPYSKFAHLFYRTTAMVFTKYTGRDKK